METTSPAIQATIHLPAEVDYARRTPDSKPPQASGCQNVGEGERLLSLAAGAFLAGWGLARPGVTGALIAVCGGALAYRGVTGHCHMYEALGVDTCETGTRCSREEQG